jgi:DNA-binding NtrC family response regulator
MKGSILFIGYDSQVEEEIGDYIQDKASAVYFAHGQEEAIQILDNHPIEIALLNIRAMTDAVFLRYINRYYPQCRVVISASKEFDEIISIFNQQNYSRLPQPLKLEELKEMI